MTTEEFKTTVAAPSSLAQQTQLRRTVRRADTFSPPTIFHWPETQNRARWRRDVAPSSLKRLWKKKFYGLKEGRRAGTMRIPQPPVRPDSEDERGGNHRIWETFVRSFSSFSSSIPPSPASFPSLVRGYGRLRVRSGSIHSLKFPGECPQFFSAQGDSIYDIRR